VDVESDKRGIQLLLEWIRKVFTEILLCFYLIASIYFLLLSADISSLKRTLILRLNYMLYYALCLSYHFKTKAVLFACFSSGWAPTTG